MSAFCLSDRARALLVLARRSKRTSQLARLLGRPVKKVSALTCELYRQGFLRRAPYFAPGRERGNPEYVYVAGPVPSQSGLVHAVTIAEVHVQTVETLRRLPGYQAEFWYAGERPLACRLLPDLTVLLKKGDRWGLWFVEVEMGHERLQSHHGYSIARKLGTYAEYLGTDACGAYRQDFSTADVRGFRVLLIVPDQRFAGARQVLATAAHDFVLVTTLDRLAQEGMGCPIWSTDATDRLNFFGKAGMV